MTRERTGKPGTPQWRRDRDRRDAQHALWTRAVLTELRLAESIAWYFHTFPSISNSFKESCAWDDVTGEHTMAEDFK